MKLNKKICINLDENEYKQLEQLATNERRKLAEFVRLVLLDATEKSRLELVRVGQGTFKKVDPKNILKGAK